MLIVGSYACNFHNPKILNRESKDVDVWGTRDEILDYVIGNEDFISARYNGNTIFAKHREQITFEFKMEEKNNSSFKLYNELKTNQIMDVFGREFQAVSINSLMLIKKSHLYFPIKWEKSIEDYHKIKPFASDIQEDEMEAYRQRVIETKKKHSYKHPKLNKSNMAFFTDSVNKIYVHDDIHRATCYYKKPMYEICKIDQSKAWVERHIFEAMPFEDQLRMVREEGYVIALERKLIPNNYLNENYGNHLENISVQEAYKYAIMRICTNLTSGWFRDFAVENYHQIKNPEYDFVAKFKSNLHNVRLVKEHGVA